jgi:hypothetical protein
MNFGYLENLIKTIKEIPKQMFYKIILHIIEKLNENGKNSIKNNVNNCAHYALLYFDKAIYFSKNYINIKDLNEHKEYLNYFQKQIILSQEYSKLLKSNIILLKDSVKQKQLMAYSGHSNKIDRLFKTKYFNIKEEKEQFEIILENYEKNLSELNGKMNLEEALCLANIIKINYKLLGNIDYENYLRLAERCEAISKELGINEEDNWYHEFKELYYEIEDNVIIIKQDEILEKYQSQFDELKEQFYISNDYIEFINYILENIPYKQYEEDKKNNNINFKRYSKELIKYLTEKYNPKQYKFKIGDELAQLYYFLFDYIHNKFKNML